MKKKNRYIKKLTTLLSGSLLSQIIVISLSPLLTRLYSPAEFGLLGVFSALLVISCVLSTLQYQGYIPIAETKSDVLHIIVLAVVLLSVFATSLFLILIIFKSEILRFFNIGAIGNLIYLLPLGVIFLSLFQIVRLYIVRVGDFALLSRYMIVRAVVMSCVQLLGYKFGVVALIIGHMAGRSVGLANMSKKFINDNVDQLPTFNVRELKAIAIRHSRFPKYVVPGNLFNQLGQQLPIMVLASLFSPVSAGFYVLAQRVLALPLDTIGISVSVIFLSEIKESAENGKLGSGVKNTINVLASIFMPLMLILVVIAPNLFGVVFGESWKLAGSYVQILGIMFFLRLITHPLRGVLTYLQKERDVFVFQIVMSVLRVLGLFMGYLFEDIYLALGLYSVLSSICFVALFIHILKLSEVSLKETTLGMIKNIIYSIGIVSPLVIWKITSASGQMFIAAALLVSVVLCARFYLLWKEMLPR